MSHATIEIVQSVPLETTLEVPGVRQTQEVWLEMIRAAKKSIDIEQFYISDQAGEALGPVLQAIQEAAKRGVKIRILADLKFYSNYPASVNALGRLENIQSKTIDYSPGVQHAKFFIVDNQKVFIGSQNFDWRALSHIHEVGLAITDDKVSMDLGRVFENDWNQGTSVASAHRTPPRDNTGDVPGAIDRTSEFYLTSSPKADTPKGISDSLTEITQLMASAKKSIQIQVMEFSTRTYGPGHPAWLELENVIREAAAKGVQVQLLVDASCAKKSKADLLRLQSFKNVEVRSVSIPAWSGGAIEFARLVHSKYLVVDGAIGWVGTENWSQGYFTQSRDVGIVVRTPIAVNQLGAIFSQVWKSNYATAVHRSVGGPALEMTAP